MTEPINCALCGKEVYWFTRDFMGAVEGAYYEQREDGPMTIWPESVSTRLESLRYYQKQTQYRIEGNDPATWPRYDYHELYCPVLMSERKAREAKRQWEQIQPKVGQVALNPARPCPCEGCEDGCATIREKRWWQR